jgi:murein tripeptide amidase MpaA
MLSFINTDSNNFSRLLIGIHAREWISPAVGTFIIRELVENYDAHPQYLDNFNIHFIPVANPDGYAHTFAQVGA